MSLENVELVRRLYERGPELEGLIREGSDLDGDPWLSLWHPECVLEDLAELPDSATFHGRDGVVSFLRRGFVEVWDEWRFTPLEIIEGRDGVFAAVENTGRSKTGVEVRQRIFQTFRIRDGMIVYVAGYLDRHADRSQ